MKTVLSFRRFSLFSNLKCVRTERKYSLKATKLSGRSLLRVSGSDSLPFLQTLLTNDVRNLQHVNCLYSYLLNVNGRILADFFVYRTSVLECLNERELRLHPLTKMNFWKGGHSSDQILIECDAKLSRALAKSLFAFKIRRDVKIELTSEYDVWAIYPDSEKFELPLVKEVASEDAIFIYDPRVASMGFRFVTRLGATTFNHLKNFTQSLISYPIIESPLRDYREHRYKLGIAEGLLDLGHAKTSFYESNGHLLNACSPTKGLFVGDKVIRKKKNLSQYIRPIVFEKIDPNLIYPGSVLVSQNNSILGTVRNMQGNVGIASVKIADKFDDKFDMIHSESQTKVTTFKPLWWSTAVQRLQRENSYEISDAKINLNQMSLLN